MSIIFKEASIMLFLYEEKRDTVSRDSKLTALAFMIYTEEVPPRLQLRIIVATLPQLVNLDAPGVTLCR